MRQAKGENMEKRNLLEYFEYLDDLRLSGETNMFGAAEYLRDEFGLDKPQSRKVLSAWMKTFSELPVEDRAQNALDQGLA